MRRRARVNVHQLRLVDVLAAYRMIEDCPRLLRLLGGREIEVERSFDDRF
jgi:hypothetical protein